MARMYAFVRAPNGSPELDDELTPIRGRVLVAEFGNWHLLQISGTVAQLTAIAALPASQCVAFPRMAREGAVEGQAYGVELAANIPLAARTKINTWLSARGYPTIPAGTTWRQFLRAVARRVRAEFDEGDSYIVESEAD